MELKKSLALLATAGMLLASAPVATYAQDNTAGGAAAGPFADVPADHWAYNAVRTLQDAKIVIGYPDGTYGGRRAMTRYEFATAIARLLPLLNNNNNYATNDDLARLRADLESKLAANQAALDALTRLVNEFQPELQRLGQDVAAVQARLANLEGRVAVLEAENQRFHVTGDINFIAEAAGSSHRNGGTFGAPGTYSPFFDKNGILQGGQAGTNNLFGTDATARVTRGTFGGGISTSNRLLENADVYHDVLLHLTGKISDTATAHVDLDFQNYLSSLGNTAVAGSGAPIGALGSGSVFNGSSFNGSGFTSTYVYQAYLDAPVSLGPLGGASLKVGRFGTQFTKWTLKQEDADIYTNLYQTDSGNILTDGGKLALKLGPVSAQGFAGKFDTTPFSQIYVGSSLVLPGARTQQGAHPVGDFTSNGASINHAAPVTQAAGARFTLGAPEGLVLGATVEQFAIGQSLIAGAVNTGATLDANNGQQYNRVSVYGLDLNGGLPILKKNGLTFSGAYTVSGEGTNAHFNNIGNKQRYQSHEELLGINLGKLNLQGGYQFVGPYFSAPGYWGKLGAWTNPTNVKGGVYFARLPITPKLSLNADYEQYVAAYGTNENGSLTVSPLQKNDHVNRYQVGVGYGLSSSYAVDLGYENLQYDLRNNSGTLTRSGKPVESYVTLGLGHSFSQNASFKLLYQIVHYNDKGTGFSAASSNGDANYSGNIAVGQFSLKF